MRTQGLSLAEMAVVLTLVGVLALGLTTLLSSGLLAQGLGQEAALAEADYQAVRSRLTQDVLRARRVLGGSGESRLVLDMDGNPEPEVVYEIIGGRVLRNGLPLTELQGYSGGFKYLDEEGHSPQHPTQTVLVYLALDLPSSRLPLAFPPIQVALRARMVGFRTSGP